jgi:Putative transposase of IS4/5 family (DUF4096)
MWTNENRGRYDRGKLRYPSDLTDAEWAFVGPLIPPAKRGGNKRTVVERSIVDGLMYILSTGCQWASLPKDLPSCVPTLSLHTDDGQKALSKRKMIPDGLLEPADWPVWLGEEPGDPAADRAGDQLPANNGPDLLEPLGQRGAT